MSLTKKRRMTEKNLAAHRRNAKLSHGPATPEGRERIHAALKGGATASVSGYVIEHKRG
jgi:hypothetical protein